MKNSQFKLIRYSKVSSSFEVYKEHYEDNNPGDIRIYGENYSPNAISKQKIKNEDVTKATAIVPVTAQAANREFHMME